MSKQTIQGSDYVRDALLTKSQGNDDELYAAIAAIAAGSGVTVTVNDTVVGVLDGKLLAGDNITFTVGNPGGNETLTIDAHGVDFTSTSIAISDDNSALANDDGSDNKNIGIGVNAGASVTTGHDNVLVGQNAGTLIESANNCVCVGPFAGENISTGLNNITLGFYGMRGASGDPVVGSQNIAIGVSSSHALTSGANNVIQGSESGKYLTSGSFNVGCGYRALYGESTAKLTGSYNIATGYQAGYSLTTGQMNVLHGYQAGYSLTTGQTNVFIGQNAGLSAIAAHDNTALGTSVCYNITSGYDNVCIGRNAGYNLTTGYYNVHLGEAAGKSTNGGATPLDTHYHTICIGRESYASASGEMSLGNSTYITAAYTAAAFSTRSDVRDKEQIEDTALGLDFINQLRPVSYHWRQENRNIEVNHGFIAQEIQVVLKEYAGEHAMHRIRGDDLDAEQNLIYTEFIAPAVKAIQELSTQVTKLTKEINILKGLS